jgi:hypothetical protein
MITVGSASDPTQIFEGGVMRKHSMFRKAVVTMSLVAIFTFSAVAPSFARSYTILTREMIRPYATKTFTATFYAGERVQVGVSGDRSTDLDLYVYDSSGELISKDDDETDECRVNIVVYRTCRLTIELVNRGSDYNKFSLWTR